MLKDKIVEQIRKARHELAEKWGFDLMAILADARQRQEKSGHRVVSFASKTKGAK